MPRPKRQLPLWSPVHVTNRGNERRKLFHKAEDYEWFIGQMIQAAARVAVDVFGYNLLPNHFHILIRQREPGAISEYIHLISCRSACHLRETTCSVGMGHVYQRRFWSHVVNDDGHYVTVLKYVEANAKRAGLVRRAEDWPWGSLWERVTHGRTLLAPSLVQLPGEWAHIVNQAQASSELEAIRNPTGRSRSTGRAAGRHEGPGPSRPRVRGLAPRDRA